MTVKLLESDHSIPMDTILAKLRLCPLFCQSHNFIHLQPRQEDSCRSGGNSFLHFWISTHLFFLGIAPGGHISLSAPPLSLSTAPCLSQLKFWCCFCSRDLVFLLSLPSLRVLKGPNATIFPCLSRTLNLRQAVFHTSHNAPFPTPPVTKSSILTVLHPEWNNPHCPTMSTLHSAPSSENLSFAGNINSSFPSDLQVDLPVGSIIGGQKMGDLSPTSCLLPAVPWFDCNCCSSHNHTPLGCQENPFCKYVSPLPIPSFVALLKRSRVSLKQFD